MPKKRQRNFIAPVIYPSNISRDENDLSSLENLSMKTPCNTKDCKGLTETNISSLGNNINRNIFKKFRKFNNVRLITLHYFKKSDIILDYYITFF